MYVVNPDSIAIVTIWQESQGEPYTGKVGVAEVIRNRMLRNYSSDGTVIGTVLRLWQFSAWNPNASDRDYLIRSLKINDNDPVVQECIRAWNQSRDTNWVKGAVLYCNLDKLSERPKWADPNKLIIKIGGHSFFGD